jgi:hypothetical protein
MFEGGERLLRNLRVDQVLRCIDFGKRNVS